MKKIGIYKITSPSGKVYIGQSIDIDRRFKSYKYFDCKKQHILYKSLKKYGFEKHKFEIITFCDITQLNDLERYYQDLYCVLGENGLNLKLTETNDRCGTYSETIKNKIAFANSKRIQSIETRLKISNFAKTRKHSEETRKKISDAMKKRPYKPLTQEARNKISLSLTGKKLPIETRNKLSLAQKKRYENPESLIKLSLAQKGRKHSAETRKKMSLSALGKKKSEETRKKLSIAAKNRKQKLNLSLQYGEQTEKSGQEGI